jgi:hypothetical protein
VITDQRITKIETTKTGGGIDERTAGKIVSEKNQVQEAT